MKRMNLKMAKMFPNHFENERGRSLIELMGMLAVMGLLTVGVIKAYHRSVNKAKVQNTANMIQTLALERQNSAISLSQGGRMLREGPHSDIYIENGTSGKFKNYFWLDTTLTDEDFCNGINRPDSDDYRLFLVAGATLPYRLDQPQHPLYRRSDDYATQRDLASLVREDSLRIQNMPAGSETHYATGHALLYLYCQRLLMYLSASMAALAPEPAATMACR